MKIDFCLCGTPKIVSRGGKFGGSVTQRWHLCETCGRHICELYSCREGILIFPSRVVETQTPEGETRIGDLPQSAIDWVNQVWAVQVRAKHELRERWFELEHDAWVRDVVHKQFPETLEGGVFPKEVRDLQEKVFGENLDSLGGYLPCPTDFKKAVIPAQVPAGASVFMLEDMKYRRVAPAESWDIPIPPDPLKVNNIQKIGGILTGLGLVWETVPNEYSKDSPLDWFLFNLPSKTGPQEFVVGWRNRVINIETPRAKGGQSELFKKLGKRDNTTSWDKGIHAWGLEKLKEYLQALLTA